MKILKIFKKKKIKKFTNKSRDVQANFYWDLLEENYELKKEIEKLKKEGKNHE